MGILLGKMNNSLNDVKTAMDIDNEHLLITGRSGSGKTYALWQIERNIIQNGGIVLVLNYHGTHQKSQNNHVNLINIKKQGIPLSILSPIKKPDESEEDIIDVAEAVVDVFYNVDRIQVQQKRALREAVRLAMQNGKSVQNEIYAIGEELKKMDDESARSVYEKFFYLFQKGKSLPGKNVIRKGVITVFDFDGFNSGTQIMMVEMTLSVIWRYFSIWGRYAKEKLFIICDEFQVLNLRQNSILEQILREGRKHNLALILATQTLQGMNKAAKAVLQQVATRIYFRPAQSEVKEILEELAVENKKDYQQVLLNLAKGECLVSGRMSIDSVIYEKPIKINFWREETNYEK